MRKMGLLYIEAVDALNDGCEHVLEYDRCSKALAVFFPVQKDIENNITIDLDNPSESDKALFELLKHTGFAAGSANADKQCLETPGMTLKITAAQEVAWRAADHLCRNIAHDIILSGTYTDNSCADSVDKASHTK
jgi:hypothetical protein